MDPARTDATPRDMPKTVAQSPVLAGYPSTYETLTELGTNPGASGVVWADFIFTQRRMVYWWQITEGSSFATVERT
jgi:hypothetical protein